ncbi:hypothetical protein [uncultured Chryseobacterium sp.]|uniref:hypothetical protein n=1 Tax=uncultured Chryseobacterium sp. TaxID=259322 RepID=UPI0025F208B9|nr:hypothetical protein [uncultured Chryseobacterium sp.]
MSLHRAGWTDIGELRNFYSDQINPRKVIGLLISNTCIDADKVKYAHRMNEYGLKKRQILSLNHFWFRLSTVFLEEEIYYIVQQLISFAEMLEKVGEVHQSDMEDIRVGMSKFSFGILMYKISYKDYNKALKVQHYLQHEGMKDIQMEEFVKKLPDSSGLR